MRPCVIFDIDGTLADVEHRRHYVQRPKPDWAAFSAAMVDDVPRADVCRLFEDLAGHYMIFAVTGREEAYRQATREWFIRHSLCPPAMLLMRPTKDYRADEVIKREIYERDIAPEHRPILVVDDRPKVIRMWRSLGLFVLDVGTGEEF